MKLTYKQKFNKKYGFPKDKAHSLRDIARITGRSYKGIKQIFEKGEGAYYSNPASVRKNVKSPQQWAYSRVYSAVMGGKAAKVDKKELGTKKKSKKMKKKTIPSKFKKIGNKTYTRISMHKYKKDAIKSAARRRKSDNVNARISKSYGYYAVYIRKK